MEEMQLRVEKSYPVDLGRGIIRLDPIALMKLQFEPGDTAEIMGKKKTTAKVWRADRQDWDQGLVRIDNFIRQNAGVSVGEKVNIRKVEAPEAKKLILALPESMMQGGPELQFGEHANEIIKRHILKRPVFRGDIIPIINSMSQPMTESLTTSQVIPLVAVETDPANSIVKVSEGTKIEIRDKADQNKVAQTLDANYKFIESDKVFTIWNNLNRLRGSFEDNKKDNEVDIITLSEAIAKTKDHHEKMSRNIKEYNAKYAVEDSITLTNLDNVVNKSDKVMYDYISNLKFQDAFNYINDLDLKLETYHKAALSETAHRKIKEIEFQINSPFFASKLRKIYKRLVSEFDKLDTAGIQGTKNIKEFIETSKELMEKMQEIEDDIEEEQKTGIRSTFSKIIFWGIPVLFSYYNLVAVNYFTVNFYTPIICYIFLSGVIYLLLKSGVNFNIIYIAYKNNIYEFKKPEFFTVAPVLTAVSVSFLIILTFSLEMTYKEMSFLFLISLIIMIFPLFTIKDSVNEAKSKLIKKEIDNLIKRYELDTSIQP